LEVTFVPPVSRPAHRVITRVRFVVKVLSGDVEVRAGGATVVD
jgi:hypothetical protein